MCDLGLFEKGSDRHCPWASGQPSRWNNTDALGFEIKKAREVLSSRGVNVGDVQEDRQGTQYFQMRDLEGNLIEVAEEP
jgi:hypothetical protein